MKNKIINKVFIYAFLFLYALVAFISFCHAIEFFDIGNTHWMSIMLAFAFELGLAVCLASILIGTNKRNNIAWVLLTLLVIVQVVGNTYSVFKYISNSQVDYYNYLAKPLLFWIQEVSQETVQIIVSWIMGAILPIVALLMTEMVANGIKEQQIEEIDNKQNLNNDTTIVKEDNPIVEEKEEYEKPTVEVKPQPEIVEEETESVEEPVDDSTEVDELEPVKIPEYEPVELKQPDEVLENEIKEEQEKVTKPKRLSIFNKTDKANAEKLNPAIDNR